MKDPCLDPFACRLQAISERVEVAGAVCWFRAFGVRARVAGGGSGVRAARPRPPKPAPRPIQSHPSAYPLNLAQGTASEAVFDQYLSRKSSLNSPPLLASHPLPYQPAVFPSCLPARRPAHPRLHSSRTCSPPMSAPRTNGLSSAGKRTLSLSMSAAETQAALSAGALGGNGGAGSGQGKEAGLHPLKHRCVNSLSSRDA